MQRVLAPIPNMPAPILTFAGMNSTQSGCGCLPPDSDGDVGPNHYINSVNSSIKIFDKLGNPLNGTNGTTYNSFFSALGTGNPCGNNKNDGDGIVFYDHMADRWVVSDFAFPAFPGTSFYQCIGVSKTSNPVSGGWWLVRNTGRSGEPIIPRRLSKVRYVARRLLPVHERVFQSNHLQWCPRLCPGS